MPSERDPRVDPIAEDVFRGKDKRTKTIERVDNPQFDTAIVRIVLDGGHRSSAWMWGFRKWAATAEVMKRGDA